VADLVEEVDVDLLEAVDGTELVELVMDFVEDKRLVVVGGVVADDVVNGVGRKEVHNLDPILEIWILIAISHI
jgi:hypothetical protein